MDTKREEDGYVEFGWIATKDLKPHPDNAREHTEYQVKQIAKSIDSLGWGRPLTISLDNYVLIGHGALLAAEDELSLMSVPFRRVKYNHDTPEAIALMLSDNKLAELSNWNYGKLEALNDTLELEGFDTTLTGFDDELKTPDFQPVGEEEQPRLDKLDPKGLKCPECGYEW
jgi:hypothetical protein